MDIETVLVPVDGSAESTEAVEYAIAIAEKYDATLHALHVYGKGVVRGVEAGEIERDAIVEQSETFAETIEELAGDVPVSYSAAAGFSPYRLSQHPGSVILDAAEEIGADFIVIPREPVTGDATAVIEKAAQYVLIHASQPVLSV